MNFDVVINVDDNYIQHCMAMLCSLFVNNSEHTIFLHVLTKSLTEENKKLIGDLSSKYNNKCSFYNVDESPLEGVQFRSKRPLSKAAYYRLLLSSVLPQEVEKVFYLDCDIIVLRDVSEIFQLELEGYALAASLDNFPYTQQHRLQLSMEVGERTFCSGVMLVNLKYWREHNCEPRLLEYAKRHRKEVHLHDQDVLNYLFKKKWFLLPPKWNRCAYVHQCTKYNGYKDFDYREFRETPMLLHYAAVDIKPWYDVYTPFKSAYMKYLRLSGYQSVKMGHVCFTKKMSLLYFTAKFYITEMLVWRFLTKLV